MPWVAQLVGVSGPVKKLISKWKSSDGEREGKGSRAAPGLSQMQIISRSENLIRKLSRGAAKGSNKLRLALRYTWCFAVMHWSA